MHHSSTPTVQLFSFASIFLSCDRVLNKCFRSLSSICFLILLLVPPDVTIRSSFSKHRKKQQTKNQMMLWTTMQIEADSKTQLLFVQFLIDSQKSINMTKFQTKMLIKIMGTETIQTFIQMVEYFIDIIIAVSYAKTSDLMMISVRMIVLMQYPHSW